MTEESGDLAANDEAIGNEAKLPERKLIVNAIGKDCAGDAGRISGGGWSGPHEMALAPVTERTAELGVAEAFVPAEVFDARRPPKPERSKREGTEAQGKERPLPAAGVVPWTVPGGAGGAGWRETCCKRARCQGGNRRGRLAGFAKKAKTTSTG
jgi:hypothetical protein